jgi:hypothetical protein
VILHYYMDFDEGRQSAALLADRGIDSGTQPLRQRCAVRDSDKNTLREMDCALAISISF